MLVDLSGFGPEAFALLRRFVCIVDKPDEGIAQPMAIIADERFSPLVPLPVRRDYNLRARVGGGGRQAGLRLIYRTAITGHGGG